MDNTCNCAGYQEYGYCRHPHKDVVKKTDSVIRRLVYDRIFYTQKKTGKQQCRIKLVTSTVIKRNPFKITKISPGKRGKIFSDDTHHGLTSDVSWLMQNIPTEWIEEALPLYRDYPFGLLVAPVKALKFSRLRDVTKYYLGSRGKGATSALHHFLGTRGFHTFCDKIDGEFAPDLLRMIKKFRTTLGISWAIEALSKPINKDIAKEVKKMTLRDLQKVVSIQNIVQILFAKSYTDPGAEEMLIDCLRFIQRNRTMNIRGRNIREAHDNMVHATHRLKYSDEPFEQLKGRENLTQEFNGYSMRPPKSPLETVQWGQDQHHCIGGYAQSHGAGTSHLFGVFKDGVLVACGMLDDTMKAMVQLYAKYNEKVTDQDVLHLIKNVANLPLPKMYWNDA